MRKAFNRLSCAGSAVSAQEYALAESLEGFVCSASSDRSRPVSTAFTHISGCWGEILNSMPSQSKTDVNDIGGFYANAQTEYGFLS